MTRQLQEQKKSRKRKIQDIAAPSMPAYKPVEYTYDLMEYERKMDAISKRIDEVLSYNSEEFVINFKQVEGE